MLPCALLSSTDMKKANIALGMLVALVIAARSLLQ